MLVLLIFAVLGRSNAQNCFGQKGEPGVCVMRDQCKNAFDGLKRRVLRGTFCILLNFIFTLDLEIVLLRRCAAQILRDPVVYDKVSIISIYLNFGLEIYIGNVQALNTIEANRDLISFKFPSILSCRRIA